MTGITPIETGASGRVGRVPDAPRRASPGSDAESSRRAGDRVEVSDLARYLAKLRQVPSVRQEMVDQVRQQIESGVYESPEKIEAAIDAMVRELSE
ncbi:MAG: flagellar biosynthesis anti-sigma factor FlgM [Phycisphaerales bacterium]